MSSLEKSPSISLSFSRGWDGLFASSLFDCLAVDEDVLKPGEEVSKRRKWKDRPGKGSEMKVGALLKGALFGWIRGGNIGIDIRSHTKINGRILITMIIQI